MLVPLKLGARQRRAPGSGRDVPGGSRHQPLCRMSHPRRSAHALLFTHVMSAGACVEKKTKTRELKKIKIKKKKKKKKSKLNAREVADPVVHVRVCGHVAVVGVRVAHGHHAQACVWQGAGRARRLRRGAGAEERGGAQGDAQAAARRDAG